MAIPTSDMPGHRALHDRVVAALDTCVESQSVDFKESATWEALQFKIIRTVVAMANLRDGGMLVIGASEAGERWELTGVSEEHLATYEVDEVVDAVHKFASPSVGVALVLVPYRNGRQFLTIQVMEFGDTPIVCRRDGPPNSGLRQGAVYVRPAGVARTTEVRSAEQMHDLLDLAAEKRARRILETARRIGLEAPPARKPFDDELGGL
jgi:predicted HTH transcriptional regulator